MNSRSLEYLGLVLVLDENFTTVRRRNSAFGSDQTSVNSSSFDGSLDLALVKAVCRVRPVFDQRFGHHLNLFHFFSVLEITDILVDYFGFFLFLFTVNEDLGMLSNLDV